MGYHAGRRKGETHEMGWKGGEERDEKNSYWQEWGRKKEYLVDARRKRKKWFIKETRLVYIQRMIPGPFVVEYFSNQAFLLVYAAHSFTRSIHNLTCSFMKRRKKNISILKITLANQQPASELNILPNMGIPTLRPNAKHSEHKATTRDDIRRVSCRARV